MKVAGVDCGVSGCCALYDSTSGDLAVHDVELDYDRRLDARWLFHLLMEWEPQLLVTEVTFRHEGLLRMTGAVVAVGQILEVDLMVVPVATWKKATTGVNSKNKTLSVTACRQLLPQSIPLLRKPRARTDSPDRAEAVLMAWYGATVAARAASR